MIRDGYMGQLFFISFLLIFISFCQAQTDDEPIRRVEKLIENTDQAGDYNDLADQMIGSLPNKLNINSATAIDFLALNFLTPVQIQAILNHRKLNGAFLSILELQTINELDFETISKLRLFIKVDADKFMPIQLKDVINKADKNLINLFSTSRPLNKGFQTITSDSTTYYPGNPNKYQLRFRASYEHTIQYGFNAEKDEGESFFKASNPAGFDFYSAHFYINKKGFLRQLALGDFQASFGQGLTIASGLGYGKSAAVLNVKRCINGLRPYRSFNENDFLRGVGITLAYKKFEFTSFFSCKKMDANLDTLLLTERNQIVVRSFINDGLHRSNLELDHEKKLIKIMGAQSVVYKNNNLLLGLTTAYTTFKHQVMSADYLYNRYYFRGKDYLKTGVHFDYFIKNLNFFGEATSGTNKANGYLLGSMISFRSILDLVLVHRNYSKQFISYNTNAFSENSNPNNEKGTYLGLTITANKKVKLLGYVDFYKLPWYSYFADGIGKGEDLLAEINYKPDKNSIIYLRFRQKQELKNSNVGIYNELIFDEKRNLRFHLEKKLTNSLNLKVRVEFSKYTSAEHKIYSGNLFLLDGSYHSLQWPLSVSARASYFNIDDYSSRIYALENDVLYSWSVSSFYGNGMRYYGLVKFKYKKISFQTRGSVTKYLNKSSIGTGYSGINSNKIYQISVLISYTLL